MARHDNIKTDHLAATKWKKGQSGNPAGPKKGTRSVKSTVRRLLEMTESIKNPLTGEIEHLTQLEILVIAQMRKARQGSVAAFQALLDRLEGKPNQVIQSETVSRLVARIAPEDESFNDNNVRERTTIKIDPDTNEIESIEYTEDEDDE